MRLRTNVTKDDTISKEKTKTLFRDIKEDKSVGKYASCSDCLLHPASYCWVKYSSWPPNPSASEPFLALLYAVLDISSLLPALMARNTLLGLHGRPWSLRVLGKPSPSPNRTTIVNIYGQVHSIQITFLHLTISTSPSGKDLYYSHFICEKTEGSQRPTVSHGWELKPSVFDIKCDAFSYKEQYIYFFFYCL